MWIHRDAAFPPVVEPKWFYIAQGIIRERNRRFSDAEMLERLKALFEKEGRLSGILIDEAEGMPSSAAYRHRFQSLVRAYQLVGYTPEQDFAYLETNRRLRTMHPQVIAEVKSKIAELGGAIEHDPTTDLLTVNGEFSVSLAIARHRQNEAGGGRWMIRLDTGLRPDITIAIRLQADNATILDYYLLPAIDLQRGPVRFAEENRLNLDAYRFSTLDFFFGMAARIRIQEAA
jgi:hypothetical protein